MKSILPSKTTCIVLTQKCNLSCSYCFEKNKNYKSANIEDIIKYFTNDGLYSVPTTLRIRPWGGELLLDTDILLNLKSELIDKFKCSQDQKDSLKKFLFWFTSNGTLIKDRIQFLKDNNVRVCVSIDGPKEITDKYRGQGVFDSAMSGYHALMNINEDFRNAPHFHAALPFDNLDKFCEVNKFFIKVALDRFKFYNVTPEIMSNEIAEVFSGNYFQFVLSNDITDKNISDFLLELEKSIRYILYSSDLEGFSLDTRKKVALSLINHTSAQPGKCGAGANQFTYNVNMDILSCVRCTCISKDTRINDYFKLGSLKDETFDFRKARLYQEVYKRKEENGPVYSMKGLNRDPYMDFCPNAFKELSGDFFHIPLGFDILLSEIHSFSEELINFYQLLDNNSI